MYFGSLVSFFLTVGSIPEDVLHSDLAFLPGWTLQPGHLVKLVRVVRDVHASCVKTVQV